MCSAKGPVKHRFFNHLISTCNIIFNQYSVGFFSYVLVCWLELCKKKWCTVACARTGFLFLLYEVPRTGRSFFVERPLLTVKARNFSRCFDPALLSAPVSAVCSAGRAVPSGCSVGPGQRLPNVQAGVLLPSRAPAVPASPACCHGNGWKTLLRPQGKK